MPGILSESDPTESIDLASDPENRVGLLEMAPKDDSDFDPVKFAMDFVNASNSKNIENDGTSELNETTTKKLKQLFEKLYGINKLKQEDDIAPYLMAIEQILENINKVNLYTDYDELEIKELLTNCLLCKHDEIKKGVCEIVIQMCNSEPDCKEFFTDRRFIFELLDIINFNHDDDFVSKALDALIVILSYNSDALELMQYNAGMSIILNTLKRDVEEWNIKIATYFTDACSLERQLPLTLISQDYIPEIVVLLAKERKSSHYHLLKLLTILVEEDYDALDELSRSNLNIKEILNGLMDSSAGLPELKDERDACIWLLESIGNLEIGRPLYDRG